MAENARSGIWVDVDFTKSKQDLIHAGKYDNIDSRILPGNFPVTGSGTGRIYVLLINFGQFIKTEEVLYKLKEMKLRPINFRELLAIGKQYPNLQRNFPIVALGSIVWKDSRGSEYCGGLAESKGRRMLGVMYFGEKEMNWKPECCFGAISLLNTKVK